MGYIGNQTSNSYTSLAKQTITGDGGASYTLDHAVANEQEIEVFVNNVRQEPSVAYTVSDTALTMTGNVESSDDFYVVFQGKAIQTTVHPEGQDLKARDGTFTGDVSAVDATFSGNIDVSGTVKLDGNYPTSTNNIAIGSGALGAITTGIQNIAIGPNALDANTTASYNVSIGHNSMTANTTGERNTAVGRTALEANTTGYRNVAVGFAALEANTTGYQNTAVGDSTLVVNTAGQRNTAVGYTALDSNTLGNRNTGIGAYALANNTTGDFNVAVGDIALYNNTTADHNTACGMQALEANTTGTNNTAVGSTALDTCTTGGSNTGIGRNTLGGLTTGNFNTALGRNAGDGLTTGYSNVLLGYDVQGVSSTSSGQVVIGIGSTSKGSNTGFIDPNGGGVYQGNNSSSWSTTSDRRIKKNIVDNNTGLDALMQLQVKNFEYRTADEITDWSGDEVKSVVVNKQGTQLGVIAQEIQQILPDTVTTASTGCLSVDPDNLTWYLVNAVKELKTELDAAKQRISELEDA